jgi:hypothetical protein
LNILVSVPHHACEDGSNELKHFRELYQILNSNKSTHFNNSKTYRNSTNHFNIRSDDIYEFICTSNCKFLATVTIFVTTVRCVYSSRVPICWTVDTATLELKTRLSFLCSFKTMPTHIFLNLINHFPLVLVRSVFNIVIEHFLDGSGHLFVQFAVVVLDGDESQSAQHDLQNEKNYQNDGVLKVVDERESYCGQFDLQKSAGSCFL